MKEIIDFLNGEDKIILKSLEEWMLIVSELFDFEWVKEYRDLI